MLAFVSIFGQEIGYAQSGVINTDTINIKPNSNSGIETPIDYSADDSTVLDLPGKKVYLYGNAKVHYEDINLDAGFIMVDFNSRDIFARQYKDSAGNLVHKPHYADSKDQFTSDSMKYNFNTKRALVYNARTIQNDGFIYGQTTFKDQFNNTHVKNARFTTCIDTMHPHFYILTKKLKIIPKKQIVTGPANLVIADINTPLLIPFGFFPILKGQTRGIIFPTYGETQDRGFYLRNLGYYFPINNYYDLALTVDFYFRGSYGAHLKSNYAKRYKYRGNFGIDFNHNKFGEEEKGIRISNDYVITWNYTMDAKSRPGQTFNANVNYKSPNYSRNNTYQQQAIIESAIQSSVSYGTSFFHHNLNMSLSSRINQNLTRQEVDLALPVLNFNIPRITPFNNLNIRSKALKSIGLSYNTDIQNSLLIKQKNLAPALGIGRNPENINILDSLKNGMIQSIPLTASIKLFNYFQLNPNISYTEYWYMKSAVKTWDSVNDTLLIAEHNEFNRASSIQGGISLNTQLFGLVQFKKGKIQAIRHVMTPSLNFSLSPNLLTSKNGYRKVKIDSAGKEETYSVYSTSPIGYPGGGKAATVSFNINNNVELKIRKYTDTGIVTKKIKLIERLNISSGHNFLAESFKWTNLNFSGNSSLFKNKINLNYNWTIDPYQYTYYYVASNPIYIGRRTDKLLILDKKSIGRLTNFGLSLGTNLNPEARKPKTSERATPEELMMVNTYPQFFVDFNIPWSLNVNYNYSYTRNDRREGARIRQTVTFNGDLKLSENWKIAFASGYDFTAKDIAVTKIDLFRDLHCWEFSFGWIPTGFLRSFDFTIRVKSSTLQDLKLNRRNFWFDN